MFPDQRAEGEQQYEIEDDVHDHNRLQLRGIAQRMLACSNHKNESDHDAGDQEENICQKPVALVHDKNTFRE